MVNNTHNDGSVMRIPGSGISSLKVQEWCEKARLAQSVERLTLNQVVGGSSPPVGDHFLILILECKHLMKNFIKLN